MLTVCDPSRDLISAQKAKNSAWPMKWRCRTKFIEVAIHLADPIVVNAESATTCN